MQKIGWLIDRGGASGRWKKGGKRGERLHVELVKRTSEIANLHVEASNEKMANNEDETNEGYNKYPVNHARRVCTNI